METRSGRPLKRAAGRPGFYRERPRPDARVPASRGRTAPRLRPLSRANGRRDLPRGSVRDPRRAAHQADGVDAARPRGLRAGRRAWACLLGPRVSPASVSRLWSRTKTSESEPRRITVRHGAPDCLVEGCESEDSQPPNRRFLPEQIYQCRSDSGRKSPPLLAEPSPCGGTSDLCKEGMHTVEKVLCRPRVTQENLGQFSRFNKDWSSKLHRDIWTPRSRFSHSTSAQNSPLGVRLVGLQGLLFKFNYALRERENQRSKSNPF
ncbi:uncharacterized protein LOC127671576 [Apodemus sylvaticus]|uniref:uncharacterized protein LOC127671576 n=1 Tax=Apodemus sylvaticus TaxID=10129 RepID=UPI0022430F87|nr:uncharacterized protein LOC127671576 [Apodemus sylvaticus]